MTDRGPADPSAFDVLERWCAAASPSGSTGRSVAERDSISGLIESYLDSYAYEHLPKRDRTWWEERWNEDEEAAAFSRMFGPEWIVRSMEEFLGWFVIRKVMAPREDIARYGPLCAELLDWMRAEGVVAGSDVDTAMDRALRAGAELPSADELGDLLSSSGEGIDHGAILETRDWVDEIATIIRVEPGALWFRSELGEEVGPVRVPERATEIARLGWELSAARFGRASDGWYVLEMGGVYPRQI
jgi:hypothetical protein